MKKKSWAQLLSILLPSSFWGHPGLTKHHTAGLGNLRQILSIRCLFTGLYNSDSKCLCQHHSRSLASPYLNSLIVERTGFIHTESTSFRKTTILPVQIYEYPFCRVLNQMHVLQKPSVAIWPCFAQYSYTVPCICIWDGPYTYTYIGFPYTYGITFCFIGVYLKILSICFFTDFLTTQDSYCTFAAFQLT